MYIELQSSWNFCKAVYFNCIISSVVVIVPGESVVSLTELWCRKKPRVIEFRGTEDGEDLNMV